MQFTIWKWLFNDICFSDKGPPPLQKKKIFLLISFLFFPLCCEHFPMGNENLDQIKLTGTFTVKVQDAKKMSKMIDNTNCHFS